MFLQEDQLTYMPKEPKIKIDGTNTSPFSLQDGHYQIMTGVSTEYNWPINDSVNLNGTLLVLGTYNQPENNRGYRVFLYFDNKGRYYYATEWWGDTPKWKKISIDSQTFHYLGDEVISSVNEDNVANWLALGSGWSVYSTLGMLNEQPSQWGFLLSWTYGNDVFQFWGNRGDGKLFFRCGSTHNDANWRTTFKQGIVVMNELALYDGVNLKTVIKAYDDNDGINYGAELTVGSGGNIFLGSGESHTNLRDTLLAGNATSNELYEQSGERLYLSSDGTIYLESNCQTIGNRKTAQFDYNGAFIVPSDTNYTTFKTRNIKASTTDLTAGTSSLANGNIYLVYE